jgi:hypothetical protein
MKSVEEFDNSTHFQVWILIFTLHDTCEMISLNSSHFVYTEVLDSCVIHLVLRLIVTKILTLGQRPSSVKKAGTERISTRTRRMWKKNCWEGRNVHVKIKFYYTWRRSYQNPVDTRTNISSPRQRFRSSETLATTDQATRCHNPERPEYNASLLNPKILYWIYLFYYNHNPLELETLVYTSLSKCSLILTWFRPVTISKFCAETFPSTIANTAQCSIGICTGSF